MLLVIILVSAFMLALGIWGWLRQKRFYENDKKSWDWRFRQACYDNENIYCILNTIGGILLLFSLTATLVVGVLYSQTRVIDDKISLYQEENAKIEEQINIIVEKYQTYEQGTFENCKIEDPTMVFVMYPELKSDNLVTKQIELYVENNKQIKKLKSEKLDYNLMAWWLYFG